MIFIKSNQRPGLLEKANNGTQEIGERKSRVRDWGGGTP